MLVRFMVTCACIINLSLTDCQPRMKLCRFYWQEVFCAVLNKKIKKTNLAHTSKLAALSEDFNFVYLIMIKQSHVYSIRFDLDVSSTGQGYK